MTPRAGPDRVAFELACEGAAGARLTVVRLRGEEAVSRPFWFELELLAGRGEELDLERLLRARATLALGRPDAPRREIHGVLSRVGLAGVTAGRHRYRFRLVPPLALLQHVGRSRVFQRLACPDIVAQVLQGGGVKSRFALRDAYPEHELAVQYRESDLDFAHRLLESEGIAYRFDHAAGSAEVVLCDAPGAWGRVAGDPSVRYREHGGEGEHLFQLARGSRLAGGVTLVTAQGTSHRLEAGCAFEVAGRPGRGERALVALRVRHHGGQEEGGAPGMRAYRNLVVAIPADECHRPAARTRRPRVLGLQTAVVTGPAGEEIHTDQHGRVKVQFPWDREGRGDDRSSCWLPVAHAWAGWGFGACFLPRVGQEVVVRFLEGDPDRPIVEGALYNGAHPPPVSLPLDKTQSALRSASSPGGSGFNELRFEDAAGAERLALHARCDERVEAENDARGLVRSDQELAAGRDRSLRTGRDRELRVGCDARSAVAGAQELEVGGDRATLTRAAHVEEVGLAQSIVVGAGRVVAVRGGAATSVSGASRVDVGGSLSIQVEGALETGVGGARRDEVVGEAALRVGADCAERVTGDLGREVGADERVEVRGALAQASDAPWWAELGSLEQRAAGGARLGGCIIELEANALSVVVGGRERLSIDRRGNVLIRGCDITVVGTRSIRARGSKIEKR